VSATRSPEERAARAALSVLVEPGTPAAGRVFRDMLASGPAAVLSAISIGSDALDPDRRMFRRAPDVDGAAVLARGMAVNARFCCPGDSEWPSAVNILEVTLDASPRSGPPPLGLWIKGRADLAADTDRSVAVVGSRAATEYGVRVATELGAELAAAGWTVVSGAAYGIDAAAHRGALATGRTTVAVLACGVDTAYPSGHGGLLQRIAATGTVVSELPPGSRPSRSRFLARNRLIAAMTRGTVVVEAAVRSGALNTAGWALDVGRDILAVPGPVTSAMSAGCHNLVRQGAAILVTDAREVIDIVGDFGQRCRRRSVRRGAPVGHPRTHHARGTRGLAGPQCRWRRPGLPGHRAFGFGLHGRARRALGGRASALRSGGLAAGPARRCLTARERTRTVER
jgi:DNA processing protein